MVKDVRKCQPSQHFGKALKSFMGYLEGTEKAAHTIKNYRLDILSFHDFLVDKKGMSPRVETLSAADLERYHDELKALGHKTNTRRRKLLTAHRFLRYLSKRNQLSTEIPTKLLTPHKIERIPLTIVRAELLKNIEALPVATPIDLRNRALLRLLAETGCLVSEVALLKFENLRGRELSIPGKAARKLSISESLEQDFKKLEGELNGMRRKGTQSFIFFGYNRHGPLGEPISSRGIELLVRFYSTRLLNENELKLTPRIFRHSAVLAWFQEGLTQEEIQRRLGLKTAYAFRTFAPLLAKGVST
jgi:site-specific recombinase XerD